jgi:hypothetical protein
VQRRRRSEAAAAVALCLALVLGGCTSEGDGGSDDTTTSTSTATSTTTTDGDTATVPTDDDPAADAGAVLEAPTGEAIVADGTIEVPGIGGTGAVYEIRDIRLTEPSILVDCPGGTPSNAQRLAADITTSLRSPEPADPNVISDDQPAPVPYVSDLPELVLIGVGPDDAPSDSWFVGVNPASRQLTSTPSTFLRPAPAGAPTSCAVEGWAPTEPAEPLSTAQLDTRSAAFVPADFDPDDYQIRVGRGEEFAYCWPLGELGTPAELGRCR